MPSKTLIISNGKWNRVKTAFNTKFTIPKDSEGKDMYTENEWIFVYIKKYVARIVKSYENEMQGKNNALPLDEDIITIS